MLRKTRAQSLSALSLFYASENSTDWIGIALLALAYGLLFFYFGSKTRDRNDRLRTAADSSNEGIGRDSDARRGLWIE
jgi:hypothetical protein